MKNRLTWVAALGSFLAVPAAADTAADFAAKVDGGWTSAAQSSDPAYDWVESEWHRVLADREDGVWLYQENVIIASSVEDVTPEAEEAARARPYFQVVIHLRDIGDGGLHTTTYRLADAAAREAARGFWTHEGAEFDPAWLGEVACMGEMQRVAKDFWQGGADCPSGYRNAVRLESRAVHAPGYYVNWDRGFDADGAHVWGPADGGYVFKRKETGQ